MDDRLEKLALTVPADLKRQARAKAILEGKSLSEVVRDALRAYLKDVRVEIREEGGAMAR
jgi:metal-responsive CopG/Arc/MetJ family transcriptional regulator